MTIVLRPSVVPPGSHTCTAGLAATAAPVRMHCRWSGEQMGPRVLHTVLWTALGSPWSRSVTAAAAGSCWLPAAGTCQRAWFPPGPSRSARQLYCLYRRPKSPMPSRTRGDGPQQGNVHRRRHSCPSSQRQRRWSPLLPQVVMRCRSQRRKPAPSRRRRNKTEWRPPMCMTGWERRTGSHTGRRRHGRGKRAEAPHRMTTLRQRMRRQGDRRPLLLYRLYMLPRQRLWRRLAAVPWLKKWWTEAAPGSLGRWRRGHRPRGRQQLYRSCTPQYRSCTQRYRSCTWCPGWGARWAWTAGWGRCG